MKKRTRIIGIILALTLVITSFAGTAAFAETVTPSTITFVDGFDGVHTIEKRAIGHYEVLVSDPAAKLSVQSSDEKILTVNLQEDPDNPGDYTFSVTAWESGDATVTFTTSDGATASQAIAVVAASEQPAYTVSSDVTGNFTLPQGDSRVIKVHYESYNLEQYSYPVLVTDDQETSLKTELLYSDESNEDYYFRVDAVGNNGQTGKLYIGSSNYIPDLLCTVTIQPNQNLRLDTTSSYVCSTGEKYHFIAYTTSATAPEVSTENDLISVDYVGKVAGGYEYEMTALDDGESFVQVTLGGENASFPVVVDFLAVPSVKTEDANNISIAKGASYTYKFTIMGGGVPVLTADTAGVVSSQLVKKDGIDYYFKVTALGDPDASTDLIMTFPDTGDDNSNVNVGKVTVTAPVGVVMTSDTNSNFSIKQGASYTFKITGATSFYPGSAGAFKTEQVGKTADGGTLYKVTAIGQPGQQAGFYMSAPGQAAQKVCVLTVDAPPAVTMKSDTNYNFSVKQGASYTFKITGATSFHPGSDGVFKTEQVGKTADGGTLYKITAIGQPGQQAGYYMSAPGQAAQKVCVVTVAAGSTSSITVQSDTNYNFSLKKGASYQFKITAAGASTVNFSAGTSGVFSISLVSHTGSDYYYKITAAGQPGQQTGLYASANGQTAKKICVVTVAN